MAQRGRMGSRVSGIFACLVLSDRSVLWRGPIRDCALRRVLAGAESRDRITSVFFMCRAVCRCVARLSACRCARAYLVLMMMYCAAGLRGRVWGGIRYVRLDST